ncbi:Elongator complex protein 5 [Syncephalis plumigaleata]|nr:Elongator complex protein 5 [Syncephalis plumigaleata]
MSLWLERLLDGKETSTWVTVEDTLEQSGVPILQAWILRACQRRIPVLFCQNDLNSNVLAGLSANEQQNIAIIELYRTFGGSLTNTCTNRLIDQLKEQVDKAGKQTNLLVVIEDITELALDTPFPLLFSRLRQINQQLEQINGQLLMGVHADLPIDAYLQQTACQMKASSSMLIMAPFFENIDKEATTRLTISNQSLTEARGITGDAFLDEHIPRFSSSSNSQDTLLCNLTHRKTNGKLVTESTRVEMEHGNIKGITAYTPPSMDVIGIKEDSNNGGTNATSTNESDPMAHLSFNLNLTDEQRQAKEKLLLPYLQAQDNTPTGKATSGSTSIYYTPDSDDDFDEEDPDDDLDI